MSDESLLADFVDGYCSLARQGLQSRWDEITPDIYQRHFHEVAGGLLARQVTLSIEMASSPSIWNPHLAPIVLRSMVDAYITLAWILENPAERSVKYVHYGLGQEKLFIEYMVEEIRTNPEGDSNTSLREMLKHRRAWLNSQLAEWATDVNVGSWSGMSVREMAIEIGRESIYRFAYVPFSGPAHNMWQHVGVYNVRQCTNPLHKYHLVPAAEDFPIHPDFMYRSAKYLSLALESFDAKLGLQCDVQLPIDYLIGHALFSGEHEPPDED